LKNTEKRRDINSFWQFFCTPRGNNELVKFNKTKSKSKTSRQNNQDEAIGLFLAWMALYWTFICILAISLLTAA